MSTSGAAAVAGMDAFRACFWRELILSKREMFVYKFKTFQVGMLMLTHAPLVRLPWDFV